MPHKDEAKAVVEQLIDAFNRKDADALAGLYLDDVTLWSSLGQDVQGSDRVIEHMRHLFTALPDEQMSGEVVITDGETIVVELVSRGALPSPYEIAFTDVFEITNGRVRSIRTYVDPDEAAQAGA